MDYNGRLLRILSESQLYQNFAAAYSETTGLPVTLRPVTTAILPFHGKPRENRWCSLMAAKSATCAACLQVQEKLLREASTKPATVTCAYGLTETAVPVKLGTQIIGYLQTGQVLPHAPNNAMFRRAQANAANFGVKLGRAAARGAYFATPVVTRRKIESLSNLLSIFAEHLSMTSNQIVVQAAQSEPPIITRAKAYIREHYQESLSLGRVAGAVHVSVFYFCKLFRRITGTNFTEFVARTRIEKAKGLLLNPNLRISEIAFDVGFDSLTHFNRTFKKFVGEPPTLYRTRLPRSV